MDTTVVGSFPLPNTPEAFERAFQDQVETGITIPCYPQLVDMNHQVLAPLSEHVDGLSLVDKEFHFSGDAFEIPQGTIVATGYGERLLEILDRRPDLKARVRGLKACLTGPFTLCSNIILDSAAFDRYKPLLFKERRAHLVPEIVEQVADLLAGITRRYKEMGFSIISIDDPFLSQIVGRRKILFHQREFITRTLDRATRYLQGEASLHVCGVLSPMLRDVLLDTSLHYLDHEFKTAPENFALFDKQLLEDRGKILAFGSVRTNPVPMEGTPLDAYVESLPEVVAHLERARDTFGAGNLLVKPDCGFGGMTAFDRLEPGLGQRIVKGKLAVMTAAVAKVFD